MNFLTVKLPAETRVLLLEDSPMRIAWFSKRIPHLTVVRTVQELKDYFETKPLCDFFFLDHDLGEGNGNGVEAAEYLKERFGTNSNAGFIHSFNAVGVANMRAILPRLLWIPFGEFEIDYASN